MSIAVVVAGVVVVGGRGRGEAVPAAADHGEVRGVEDEVVVGAEELGQRRERLGRDDVVAAAHLAHEVALVRVLRREPVDGWPVAEVEMGDHAFLLERGEGAIHRAHVHPWYERRDLVGADRPPQGLERVEDLGAGPAPAM
jgi:hypothetical protein